MIELFNSTEQVRLEMGHSAWKRALTIPRHPNDLGEYEEIYEEAFRF